MPTPMPTPMLTPMRRCHQRRQPLLQFVPSARNSLVLLCLQHQRAGSSIIARRRHRHTQKQRMLVLTSTSLHHGFRVQKARYTEDGLGRICNLYRRSKILCSRASSVRILLRITCNSITTIRLIQTNRISTSPITTIPITSIVAVSCLRYRYHPRRLAIAPASVLMIRVAGIAPQPGMLQIGTASTVSHQVCRQDPPRSICLTMLCDSMSSPWIRHVSYLTTFSQSSILHWHY